MDSLYETFWSLQSYLYNLQQILDSESDDWDIFCSGIDSVISYFEKNPIEDSPNAAVAANLTNQMDTSLLTDAKSDFFSPKFLTSRKLFDIQMKDAYFRRHILIQYLIVFQCLLLHSPNSDLPAMPKTAAISLTQTQESWLNEKTKVVFRLIDKTGGRGRYLVNACKKLLQHEKQWIKWKADSCPNYERPEFAENEVFPDYAPNLTPFYQDGVDDDVLLSRTELGTPELSRLWRSGKLTNDHLIALTQDKSVKPPSLETFLDPLKEQMDPENDIEKAYRSSSDATYTWKCIRLILFQHMEYFKHIGHADIECLPLLPLAKKVANIDVDEVLERIDYSGFPKQRVIMVDEDDDSVNAFPSSTNTSRSSFSPILSSTTTKSLSDQLVSQILGDATTQAAQK